MKKPIKTNSNTEKDFILLAFTANAINVMYSSNHILMVKVMDIDKYLMNLCTNHQRYNLIVCDLSFFIKFIQDIHSLTDNFIIKPFKYRNIYYSLELIPLLKPRSKLIIRDYYNQFKAIIAYIYTNFDISILNKRIYSIASISFNIYKQCYSSQYRLIGQLNHKEDTYIRKSFYGGRSEIFKPICATRSYYYDINSLYPFIKQTMLLPIGKPIYHDTTYFNNIEVNMEIFYGFIDVEVSSNTSAIGVLPIKSTNNHLELGTFRGVYFSKELLLAL